MQPGKQGLLDLGLSLPFWPWCRVWGLGFRAEGVPLGSSSSALLTCERGAEKRVQKQSIGRERDDCRREDVSCFLSIHVSSIFSLPPYSLLFSDSFWNRGLLPMKIKMTYPAFLLPRVLVAKFRPLPWRKHEE